MWGGKTRHPGKDVETGQSINATLELFEGLSRPEIERIGGYFTVIDVAAGRDLGRRGTLCQSFCVVLSGQVAMSFDETPVGLIPPGCFFGEVALLDPRGDYRRRGSATAISDARIAIATPREFAGLLHEFPLVAQRIYTLADRRRAFVAAAGQDRIEHKVDQPVEAAEVAGFPMHVPS